MAAITGLTLVKRFTYRGNDQEEFSNTYHFKQAPPGDDSSWQVLTNDAVAKEQTVLNQTTRYVRAYGYDSDDPKAHHVFAFDWGETGPLGSHIPQAAGRALAGDQAACVEWRMNRLSSKGKPIYLRKYFHGGQCLDGDGDELEPTYVSALGIFVDPVTGMNGIHGGLRTGPRSDKDGNKIDAIDDTVVSGKVIPYTTTRTLKRRGKRPPPGG